ncbi:MAG: zinc metallopeptidase [Peptococcaceae bacterium]|jgi:Zn-dependent membrane protease YugP|nr:zinc metallopeptidase [Peptococcaceae bacterium]MDH7524290.1 zinc metallopeptidase [Peptococcaceae bacterium]
MYYNPFFDPSMIIVIPGLILAMYAQAKVQSTFARYLRVASGSGVTGAAVARSILDSEGIRQVEVEMIEGNLTDHYDPRTKTLRLSPQVYRGTSLASLGVAAHEAGHAIQHYAGYIPLNIRNSLVPMANFGSTLAFPLFFIGLFFSYTMVKIGIYLFAAVVLFQLVTLPVEFNASRRALVALQAGGYISTSEVKGTKAVLDAAALTYVAAALMGLLQLVRLLLIAGIFGRRDE